VDEVILNIVNAFVLSLAGLFGGHWARNRKKTILRNRLSKEAWKWRSFDSLCRSIREDGETTKGLLIELGARLAPREKTCGPWTKNDSVLPRMITSRTQTPPNYLFSELGGGSGFFLVTARRLRISA
jgi:hypothetical protein